jgi:tetratricopeptide (TPR) repeat protein
MLATVLAVFPQTLLFLHGDEMVLLCGRKVQVHYGRLRAVFSDPRARLYMEQGGFWDALQVAACYTADTAHLRRLSAGARPYRRDSPERPPVLARDLSEQSRADVLALVAQCRLSAQDSLDDVFAFMSANEKTLAMGPLQGFHVVQTMDLLGQVGAVARANSSIPALMDVLRSPAMELDLFAPQVQSRQLKLAVALYRLNLPGESLALLKGDGWPDGDRYDVWYWRGRNLEALNRPADAIAPYEKALTVKPDAVEVLLRLSSIHLARGETARAVERLQAALERDRRNVEAMVRLGYLYSRMDRFEEAAELASRALEVEPSNRAARDLLELCYLRSGRKPDGAR